MKDPHITFEKVSPGNLDLAIKVQKSIFPNENGALNLKFSIDKELMKEYYDKSYRENLDFWICKNDGGEAVGITGIYSYFEYPDDAWLGWYGVVSEYRGQGYGKKILLWTMEKAKEFGYKNMRLYTDMEDNNKAVELYRSVGMIEELYIGEDMGDEQIFIFSKSLTSDVTDKLGNVDLFLKKQAEIQKKANLLQ